MWKRENESTPPTPAPASPSPSPRRESEAPAQRSAESHAAPASSGGRASIGAATVVRGEVSGEEDLLVEGRIEGKILLRQNALTVGAKGRVSAEVHARAVLIDGEVEGNIVAEEQIVLRRSGRVHGDLVAPRVTIEDGARFKGSIDMEPKPQQKAQSAAPAPAPARAASSSSGSSKGDPLVASLAAAASNVNG